MNIALTHGGFKFDNAKAAYIKLIESRIKQVLSVVIEPGKVLVGEFVSEIDSRYTLSWVVNKSLSYSNTKEILFELSTTRANGDRISVASQHIVQMNDNDISVFTGANPVNRHWFVWNDLGITTMTETLDAIKNIEHIAVVARDFSDQAYWSQREYRP